MNEQLNFPQWMQKSRQNRRKKRQNKFKYQKMHIKAIVLSLRELRENHWGILNNFYVQNTYLCVLLCSNYLTYMVSVCDNIYFAFALNIITTVDGEEAEE